MTGRRPRTPARRVRLVDLNRWPTRYGNCMPSPSQGEELCGGAAWARGSGGGWRGAPRGTGGMPILGRPPGAGRAARQPVAQAPANHPPGYTASWWSSHSKGVRYLSCVRRAAGDVISIGGRTQSFVGTLGTPRTRVAPAAVVSGAMNRASSVVGREETLAS